MDSKMIGVLLSVYEGDSVDYVKKAVDSIYDQTYDSVLYIGVDGKIDENIMQYLKSIEKNINTRILWYNENRGLPCVLNDLVEECLKDGVDYIARLDADDISLPDRIEKQVNFFEENPQVSITGGAAQEIDEDGNKMLVRKYPAEMEEIKKYIVKANPLLHSAVMFRIELFESGLRYNPKLRMNQDLNLWFDIINSGYIISNLPDILIYFRRTRNTYKRRRSTKSIKSEFNIYYNGIKSLHGYNWRLIYPILRFCVRLIPPGLIKFFYDKAIFKKILK